MATRKLATSLPDDERLQRYSKAGFNFSKWQNGSYWEFNDVPLREYAGPDSPSISRIKRMIEEQELNIEDLRFLIDHLPEDSLLRQGIYDHFLRSIDTQKKLQEEAEARLQAQEKHPEYPHLTSQPPFSWELNPRIPSTIRDLASQLQEKGITTKVGMEFEFGVIPLKGESWSTRRDQIVSELETQSKRSIAEKDRDFWHQRAQRAKQFGAQDVIMYDMIEWDKQMHSTARMLIDMFGDEYYDNPGTLELKTTISDTPLQAIERKNIIWKELYTRAAAYGMALVEGPPTTHVSFSFWKDGKNLLEGSDTHSPDSDGGKIIGGVTRTLYDACPTIISSKSNFSKPVSEKLGMPAYRGAFSRSAHGRFEVRLGGAEGQHPELTIPIVMAGALYGFDTNRKGKVEEARPIRSGTFHHKDSEQFKMICYSLNGAEITANGTIKCSSYMKAVVHELGFSDDDSSIGKEVAQAFLNCIRVPGTIYQGEGNNMLHTIEWPTYSDIAKSIPLLHRMPLSKHKETLERCLNQLSEAVTLTKINQKFVIDPVYDLNALPKGRSVEFKEDAKSDPELTRARRDRMADSEPLQRYLKDFHTALIELLDKRLAEPAAILSDPSGRPLGGPAHSLPTP